MRKFSPKTVSLIFSVLVICFAVAFYALSWTKPTQAPPGGNIPTPLNAGPVGQQKEGGLILNTGGAANGLIVDQGNVGIGTTNPSAGIGGQLKLDIEGNVGAAMYCDKDGNNCLTSSGLGGRVYIVGPQSCIGSPACTATVNCPPGTHVLYAIYHIYNQNGCPPGDSDVGAVPSVIENGDCNLTISPGGNAPHLAFTIGSSCSNITAVAGPAGMPQACIRAFCVAD